MLSEFTLFMRGRLVHTGRGNYDVYRSKSGSSSIVDVQENKGKVDYQL